MTKPRAEQWSEAVAFNILRTKMKLKHLEMASRLMVTPEHLSAIMGGRRNPSAMIVRLATYEFQVNPVWMKTGIGPMRLVPDPPPGPEAIDESLLPGMIDALPKTTGLDATGVIERLKDVLDLPNEAALAHRLQVDHSTISHWKKNNRIPGRRLMEALKSTNVSLDQLFVGPNGEPLSQLSHCAITSYKTPRTVETPPNPPLASDQQLLKSIHLFLQNATAKQRRKFITDVALLAAGENLDDKVWKGKQRGREK